MGNQQPEDIKVKKGKEIAEDVAGKVFDAIPPDTAIGGCFWQILCFILPIILLGLLCTLIGFLTD